MDDANIGAMEQSGLQHSPHAVHTSRFSGSSSDESKEGTLFGQILQVVLPAGQEYVPRGHCKQTEALTVEEKYPL